MPRYHLLILLLVSFLAACKSTKNDDSALSGLSDSELYSRAMYNLESGHNKKALEFFEKTEQEYPYSEWASHSKIMQIYLNYSLTEFEEAITQAEIFAQLNPVSPYLPYVYYIRALSYYDQILPVDRDQESTEKALNALQDVITRFPNSPYAKDAQIKLDLARDHLAAKEMEVAHYYLKLKALAAALSRFNNVIEKYDNTLQVQEALYRMVEINIALGLKKDAERYVAILAYNYPKSEWYKKSLKLLPKLPS